MKPAYQAITLPANQIFVSMKAVKSKAEQRSESRAECERAWTISEAGKRGRVYYG